MSEPFAGFSDEAFEWIAGITLNNSREQYQATKKQYKSALQEPIQQLLELLAEEFGGTPKIFRPNRDIRFSADKSPYKTSISGHLAGAPSVYYLQLDMDGLFAASGKHEMSKEELSAYRAALTGPDSLQVAPDLRDAMKKSRAIGTGLKTVPRGIPKDHPNADLVGFTSIISSQRLEPDQVTTTDVPGFVRSVWEEAEPLNAWLQTHVGLPVP